VKWHKKIRDLFSKKKTANSGHSLSKSQNNTEKEDFLKRINKLRINNSKKRNEAKQNENEYLATLNMNKRIQYESEKARNPYLNSYMSKISKSVSASEELRKLDEELYNKFAIGDKNAAKLEISEKYPEIAKKLGIVIPKKNEVFTATQQNKKAENEKTENEEITTANLTVDKSYLLPYSYYYKKYVVQPYMIYGVSPKDLIKPEKNYKLPENDVPCVLQEKTTKSIEQDAEWDIPDQYYELTFTYIDNNEEKKFTYDFQENEKFNKYTNETSIIKRRNKEIEEINKYTNETSKTKR